MSNQPDTYGSRSYASADKGGSKIDIPYIIDLVKKHWWWFAISVFFFVSVGVVMALRTNKKFVVEANVMVRPEGNSLGNIAADLDISSLAKQSNEVDDELAFLGSYSVMNTVVREMKLNVKYVVKKNILQRYEAPDDSPVELFYDTNIADTLSVGLLFKLDFGKDGKGDLKIISFPKNKTVGEYEDLKFPIVVRTPYGRFGLQKTQYYEKGKSLKENIWLGSYAAATEAMQREVSITIPSKKSNKINLEYQTTTPEFGRAVLDRLIEVYAQRDVREKQKQLTRTLNFVNDRLEMLTNELAQSETSIQEFKRRNNLTDISSDVEFALERMSDVQKQLLGAETRLELIEMSRKFLANPENKYSLIPTMGTGSEAVNIPGVGAYNDLILKRLELENNAKGSNVALRQIDEQLDAMRENVMSSMDRSYKNQSLVVGNLRSQNSENIGRISSLPENERQFVTIKRRQTVQERLFMYLLQLREETELNISKAEPRSEVIDQAYILTEPVGRGMKATVLFMFLLGLAIPAGILYLKERFRNKFATKQEVEKATSIPVIGEICTDDSGKHIVVANGAHSSAAELFRLVRNNLKFVLRNPSDKVVLVTSSTSGEGKSFTSVNLAYSLALLPEKKVLLMGMDIRKPRLPEYLGIRPRFGVTEYLTSPTLTLEDIITHIPNMLNLDVIVAGALPPNPAELLAEPKLETLIKRLRGMYDYIIIDSAPVGMVSDTFTLAPLADASIYVCRANYTPLRDLEFATEVYEEKRLPSMGLLINGTKQHSGYGYGYGEGKHLKRR